MTLMTQKYLSISSSASSNTTVYILYAVGGLVMAVIIVVVRFIAVRKTSSSTGSVMSVNKRNESRDEQKSDTNEFEENVYENDDIPNTDKSSPMKPSNRPEVPKSQTHAVYGNVQLSVGY
ncbi:uncharacterized protein LOC143710516 [Siphateles boraxobius]|uniref:uncharacterized protein LOC143710516 n=1 Tax=Siphateles boraxobius TaxID=180520 RepID=UPI004063C71C